MRSDMLLPKLTIAEGRLCDKPAETLHEGPLLLALAQRVGDDVEGLPDVAEQHVACP